MILDILSVPDDVIVTICFKRSGELISVALPLAHIQEHTLTPAPRTATDPQKFLWRIDQLAKHPEADEFSRYQLQVVLNEIKEASN